MAAQGADVSTRLKILFVINDLYTRGNGLAASVRRTIMLLVLRTIRCHTFVSRSLHRSFPLRATHLPVRIVAR